MIKFEKTEVLGWEHAVRGMRNPKNSWAKSDSSWSYKPCEDCNGESACTNDYILGLNDYNLMMYLSEGGPVHAKYRRMIVVYVDITAPLYWWKEFDTYKVGTVANSCSTMHKIHAKEFTLDDFSHEHLRVASLRNLEQTIVTLNAEREAFIGKGLPELKGDKQCWYSMIQLLPSSYNQKRTIMLNYEVLADIYPSRKNHKLDEWHDFCDWIEQLPYSEIVTGDHE